MQHCAKTEIVIRAQEQRIRLLEKMAVTDELTGLANRRGFTLFLTANCRWRSATPMPEAFW